jgi:hypothetical protein
MAVVADSAAATAGAVVEEGGAAAVGVARGIGKRGSDVDMNRSAAPDLLVIYAARFPPPSRGKQRAQPHTHLRIGGRGSPMSGAIMPALFFWETAR